MQIALPQDYPHARPGAALWCGGKVLSGKLGSKAKITVIFKTGSIFYFRVRN